MQPNTNIIQASPFPTAALPYSPTTQNGWIGVLRVVTKAAVLELDLARDPMTGIRDLDTSTHATYTEEQPNSLGVGEVPAFLAGMLRLYPQHFAFTCLGFALGQRPSTMRPMRRSGPTPDFLADDAVLLVRRSQTIGEEVMETTKTKIRQRITLPAEIVDVLRWHVDRLPDGPMRDSALLFPSETGSFRARSSLVNHVVR